MVKMLGNIELIQLKEAILKAWEIIKKAVAKAWEAIKKFVISLMKNPPVGYKRLAKWYSLQQYEKQSAGKSNNWRKLHGLHLARRNI